MGGAVSVHTHDEVRNKAIKHLLSDPNSLSTLFEDIAGNQPASEGRINNQDQISLVEVITFFNASRDPLYEGFCANSSIAKQALKYTESHSKKKKRYKDQISKKQFKVFLPTMFLFSHLWKIFESEFDNDIDDKRIFRHEYEKAWGAVSQIDGIEIKDEVTHDMWNHEFDKIDKNKNGFVSFGEFCTYVTDYIITPSKYIDEIMNENHEMFLPGSGTVDIDSEPFEKDQEACSSSAHVGEESTSLTAASEGVPVASAPPLSTETPVVIEQTASPAATGENT